MKADETRMKMALGLVAAVLLALPSRGAGVPAELTLAPAGARDRTADILAAVDAVRLAGGGKIVFSPGEYRLETPAQARWWVSNHHDPLPRNVFLPVTNVADVVLESTDARFVCDGEGIALALVDVKNVTVRGLSFDYARPYFSEWRLKDGRLVGDAAKFPWKVEDGKLLALGRGWTSPQRLAEFFDGTTRTFLGAQWWSGAPDWKFAYPDGSVAVTRGGFRPNPTVFLYRAVNTAFADCGVYSSAGIGLMAQRSDTVSVHGWRTRNGRYFTSLQADATHFSNCRGAVTVTDSVFEGMVDDAINVHSTCLEIVEIPARDRLVCRYRHPASVGFEVFLPGERLRLIRSRTLEPGAEVAVRAAEMKGSEFVHLTLARPVPDGYGVGDAVENVDWQPSVVFRGNVVRNCKPRATLFTTPGRVVCESNLFDHVAGHPVELAGDALDWYESGACRDVTIRGNVFRGCGKVGGKAMVLIDPHVRDLAHQRVRYHRNILIEGNRFEDFAVPLVAGHSVSNLVLRDNVVVDGPATVDLRHAESVVVGSVTSSAAEPVRLWTGGTYPARTHLARAAGVRYSTIKAHEPKKDGYEWLHGVGLGWHGSRLYATYGTNPGKENTAGECCMCRYSEDDGRTWSVPQVVDAGEPAARLAVSHGVLLSKDGRLLSFMGAFTNDMRAVHTRLSVLDPGATSWRRVGVVVGDGFWPMQPPERMSDGNWIMGGLRCAKGLKDAKGGNRPAVAISAGDDLTKWRLVVVEEGAVENCWGEATVDVHGPFATLVSRPGWKNVPAVALVATSADFGRSWTELRPSNLPMTTAKPYTGRLSDGRRYALNSMTADGRWNRDSVVLALSRPGEWAYSQALLVRSTDDFAPDARGRRTHMCYPAAVERDGKLYIGYSISRLGGNRNDAELAVVPLPD